MTKRKKVICLTRDCWVEDILFDSKARKGNVLYFMEGEKELIHKIIKSIISTYRLEKKEGIEGVIEMFYYAGDDFDISADYNYWCSKKNCPELYQKTKKALGNILK
ncbi:hypothetical protein JW949_02755 [Candidatus Woesearchaeota archaeon]|nr:hypothetical protein [Candidatus Woesearchaeota archaeon]